ncbi:unnamed protein product [Ambrosiozyma monospora]|uniref:Unnamed protein product n=1 Tax=Ambrosiozyma monospora TaxID=43982 RepID=A0ACB5SRM7_AMBMO|nr:unnamed protein product [Ambrosiozyma monospora]
MEVWNDSYEPESCLLKVIVDPVVFESTMDVHHELAITTSKEDTNSFDSPPDEITEYEATTKLCRSKRIRNGGTRNLYIMNPPLFPSQRHQFPKNGPSPYEVFHRTPKKVYASKLIPFGSRVFIRNPNEKQKVGKTFSASIFLGYDRTLKIIKHWKVKTRRVGRTADFRVDILIVFPLVKSDDTNLLDINFDDSGNISSSISYGRNFGFGRVSSGSAPDGSKDPDIQDVEMSSPLHRMLADNNTNRMSIENTKNSILKMKKEKTTSSPFS